jgi:hypothetical protein
MLGRKWRLPRRRPCAPSHPTQGVFLVDWGGAVIAAIMGFNIVVFLLPKDRKRKSAKRMISEGKLYDVSHAKQLRRELSKDKSKIEDLELANQLGELIEKQEGRLKARR